MSPMYVHFHKRKEVQGTLWLFFLNRHCQVLESWGRSNTRHRKKKVKKKMECLGETMLEPVSPTGQYLNSSVLSLSIISVLEIGIPINDSQTMSLLQNVFLPINPRFSSVMVSDCYVFLISNSLLNYVVFLFIK